MASEKHKNLANIIKECHSKLRKSCKEIGAKNAWEKHKTDKNQLEAYGKAMKELAQIWEQNCNDINSPAFSRVKWVTNYCISYYDEGIYLIKRAREIRQLRFWFSSFPDDQCNFLPNTPRNGINVLDVGSCYNAYAAVSSFNITALDLYPANDSVLAADFLKVDIADIRDSVQLKDGKVVKLKQEHFHCVIFSLLLEYLPSSTQRMECIRKAFALLCTEGILIIITPDSAHLGKNVLIWKQWRQTLASMGLVRISFEKLPHITCMVFRKPVNIILTQQWLNMQPESYTRELPIPQDSD